MHFQLEVLAEVALAMLLGGLIGFERELAERPAGLRTHMMVAGAATLLVAMGDVFLHRVTEGSARELHSDPIRIVEAVVTGVSFLGAGAIFRRGGESPVEGLTTAAGILLTAAVGICVALRQLLLAIGAVVLVLATLRGLLWVERVLAARKARSALLTR
jgi:putative Mg2+ transporter-C (MgtC) family protein